MVVGFFFKKILASPIENLVCSPSDGFLLKSSSLYFHFVKQWFRFLLLLFFCFLFFFCFFTFYLSPISVAFLLLLTFSGMEQNWLVFNGGLLSGSLHILYDVVRQQKEFGRADLHMISVLHHQLMGRISQFRMRWKFQFQPQNKMTKNNLFDLQFVISNSGGEFDVFDPEKIVLLWG